MKSFKILLAVASLSTGMFVAGCTTSETTTHKEGMLGGSTDKTTKVTENPVTGNTTVEKSETKTK